ncbi:hypothetical protein C7974DRAFT_372850 [Boeremia exigua]|uniref:uncharacterized protein n=1 Tax=Boeremia exigua TaxID=749465 RepID=UPI001E8DD759|nr:uncharacterized protein C7974DRAFT_372850 [Boeremia exigua]KAH6643009.1 hypothetical protein C7974DRAFT_372850 [Boeremia exigua]
MQVAGGSSGRGRGEAKGNVLGALCSLLGAACGCGRCWRCGGAGGARAGAGAGVVLRAGAACWYWCWQAMRASRSFISRAPAGRAAGIHSVIRAGAMREGYLRQHPHAPCTDAPQASLRRHWAPARPQLRPRAEAARGGWIHLLVLLGTARALSH